MAYNEVTVPIDDNLESMRKWCMESLGPKADCLSSMIKDGRTTIGHKYPWTTAYKKTNVSKGSKKISFHFHNPEHALMFKLAWL